MNYAKDRKETRKREDRERPEVRYATKEEVSKAVEKVLPNLRTTLDYLKDR